MGPLSERLPAFCRASRRVVRSDTVNMSENPLGIFRARILNAGTTAARVSTVWPEEWPSSVAVYNNGATTVYLGGPDVTVAQGFPLPAGGQAAFDRVDGLYVIAASTVELRVLEGS